MKVKRSVTVCEWTERREYAADRDRDCGGKTYCNKDLKRYGRVRSGRSDLCEHPFCNGGLHYRKEGRAPGEDDLTYQNQKEVDIYTPVFLRSAAGKLSLYCDCHHKRV